MADLKNISHLVFEKCSLILFFRKGGGVSKSGTIYSRRQKIREIELFLCISRVFSTKYLVKLILAIQSKLHRYVLPTKEWIMKWNLWTFYLKTQTHNFNLTETSKFCQLIIYLWLQESRRYPLHQRDWTILLVISHKKPKSLENHEDLI